MMMYVSNAVAVAALAACMSLSFATRPLTHQGVAPRVPVDTLVPVKPCDAEKVYSPDDADLRGVLGYKPTIPSKNPQYPRGLTGLREYFNQQMLDTTTLQGVTLRIRVGFLVNCEGDAGNFILLTNTLEDFQKYGEQVLRIASNMPQQWIAGEYKSEKVDCYQIITFTVKDGKFLNMMYR
jgi:hypothetical protein